MSQTNLQRDVKLNKKATFNAFFLIQEELLFHFLELTVKTLPRYTEVYHNA